jgi:hypothetical protein
MKLNSLIEASAGEHAVNFSEDLGDMALDDERQKEYLLIGGNAIKSGFQYKGTAAGMMNLVRNQDDDSVELTLMPKKGTLMIEVINIGEQKFSFSDLHVSEFIENTEADFSRIFKELIHLFDALDGAQKFIGTAPTFEN